MTDIRNRVRALILGLAGFLVAFLVIRFFLLLLVDTLTNPLVKFVIEATNPFVAPFSENTVVLGTLQLDAPTFVAIIVYIVGAMLISEIVTSFLQDSLREVLINIVDAFFKILEFLLISRLVLRLFGFSATNSGSFVATIYSMTGWAAGILPDVDFMQGTLEFSTIAVLIIVIIIDLATEGLIVSLFPVKPVRKAAPSSPSPAPSIVRETVPVSVPTPPQQNITINVPVPQVVAPRPVDKQIINVQPAPPRALPPNGGF